MSDAAVGWYFACLRRVRAWRVTACCGLVPLKPGLLLLAYLNLCIAVVLIVGVASGSAAPLVQQVQAALFEDASASVCVLAPTADLAFTVLLVAGLHRRDVVLLGWYVWYGLAVIAVSVLVYSILLAALSALYIVGIVCSLVYQAYLIVLVRSVIVEIQLAASKGSMDVEAASRCVTAELAASKEISNYLTSESASKELSRCHTEPTASKEIAVQAGPGLSHTHNRVTSTVTPSSVVTPSVVPSTLPPDEVLTVTTAVPSSIVASARPVTPIAAAKLTGPSPTPANSLIAPSSSKETPVTTKPATSQSVTPAVTVSQSQPTSSNVQETEQSPLSSAENPGTSEPECTQNESSKQIESTEGSTVPPPKAQKRRRFLWK